MHTNEILEEVWATKDRLWREAGGDMRVFCEQLRQWSATAPMPGPVLQGEADLRRYMLEASNEAGSVREEGPRYGGEER